MHRLEQLPCGLLCPKHPDIVHGSAVQSVRQWCVAHGGQRRCGFRLAIAPCSPHGALANFNRSRAFLGKFSTSTNSDACSAWRTCQPGTQVFSSGSATADRRCASCPAGTSVQLKLILYHSCITRLVSAPFSSSAQANTAARSMQILAQTATLVCFFFE